MSNIIPFNQAQGSAIDDLEQALGRAKSGEIQAVCISWVKKDGSIGGSISLGKQNFCMIASLRHIARTFENMVFNSDC